MKKIKIDLTDPLERVLATVLSLPTDEADVAKEEFANREELKLAVRQLYEAAGGRQVETPVGYVAIAPPVAAFLKATPFFVETQLDFIIELITRLLAGPPCGTTDSVPGSLSENTVAPIDLAPKKPVRHRTKQPAFLALAERH